MAIPDSQLDTWYHQGPINASRETYKSIRTALLSSPTLKDLISSGNVKVYLQGSYANDTNIRGDSDVDITVELVQTFHSNIAELPTDQLSLHESSYSTADYQWHAFRNDVLTALENYYGPGFIDKSGRKSIKVLPSQGRLRADVVPVATYRKYSYFYGEDNHIKELGIQFFDLSNGRQIVNFPEQHYQNGVIKHQSTNDEFKGLVRAFKNART